MKNGWFLLFPVLLFSTCTDDGKNACDTLEDLGTFSLLPTSKAAIPYNATDQRAVFVDSLGGERSLEIIQLSDGYLEQQFTAACLVDNSTFSTYSWMPEKTCYELKDETTGSFSYQLCVEMQYNLVNVAEKQVADLLSIAAYSSSSRLQREGDYSILLAPRNFMGEIITEGTTELLDELTWQGRTLTQVYHLESVNNIGLPRELYYTKAEGLVAFKDYASDTFFFFDRIE